jgi:hypothetical protein
MSGGGGDVHVAGDGFGREGVNKRFVRFLGGGYSTP